MNVLVTGAAGFIGYHLSKRLAGDDINVTGLDNLNHYYNVNLKLERLNQLGVHQTEPHTLTPSTTLPAFTYVTCDLCNQEYLHDLFEKQDFDVVINLAAQAGVRYSLENPHAYLDSNITGFLNILECCRKFKIKHLMYASSSSVYGANKRMPFAVEDVTEQPLSLYAATKKSNELMAYSYAHLFGIPCTGLRFFTVYGPMGRPDMAYFKFANLITHGQSIDVYNEGNLSRDFTYIDDIIESIVRLIPKAPGNNPAAKITPEEALYQSCDETHGRAPMPVADIRTVSTRNGKHTPYRIFNIGNGAPVNLLEFICILEEELGASTQHIMLPMQPGDVTSTWSDTTDLSEIIDYRPRINIREGISRFVAWYQSCDQNLHV